MNEFYGMMTLENAEQIMNFIYEKIKDKEYVFTSVNEGFKFGDHVEMRQTKLRSEPNFWTTDGDYSGFHFNEVGYIWMLSTSQKEPGYDHELKNPYVVIEHKKIKITHRASAGHLLHWQILVIEK